MAVIWISDSKGTCQLLILSQVILSLQLPLAIVPLVHFTSKRLKMGAFVNRPWVQALAWAISTVIIALSRWCGELQSAIESEKRPRVPGNSWYRLSLPIQCLGRRDFSR
jgi:hypothetical protein